MRNPSAVGFTGGSRRMWGDLVGNSLLTDEDFKRLARDLASGLISINQVRAAGLEDEIRRYLDDDMYSVFLDESCSSCSYCEKIYADNRLHETICLNKSCPVWLNGHPQDVGKKFEKTTVAEWSEKAKKRIKEDMKNPCAGCEFRKYHDWAEPTWTGFSQHYYDCEKPGCPMWSRLWWRNNDDGTPLMDQQPIRLTRKFQHAVYEIVRFLNEIVELLLN